MRTIGKIAFFTVLTTWVVRLIGIVVLLLLFGGVLSYCQTRAEEAPDIDKAPWAIQTYSNDDMRIPSRIYFAERVEYREDNTPVMTNYWRLEGENFKYVRGKRDFPVEEYGIIEIRRR